MDFTQQGDAFDAAARAGGQRAQALYQRLDDLDPVLCDRVVGAGQAPRVNRLSVVGVDRQGALWDVGDVVRVLRQHGFNRRVDAEVGGEEVEHEWSRVVAYGSHDIVDSLAVDMPGALLKLQ